MLLISEVELTEIVEPLVVPHLLCDVGEEEDGDMVIQEGIIEEFEAVQEVVGEEVGDGIGLVLDPFHQEEVDVVEFLDHDLDRLLVVVVVEGVEGGDRDLDPLRRLLLLRHLDQDELDDDLPLLGPLPPPGLGLYLDPGLGHQEAAVAAAVDEAGAEVVTHVLRLLPVHLDPDLDPSPGTIPITRTRLLMMHRRNQEASQLHQRSLSFFPLLELNR